MLRRLIDRLVPDSALKEFGLVAWRTWDYGEQQSVGLVASAATTISVSRELLNASPFKWYGSRWIWQRWPVGSIWDLFPTFFTSSAPVVYHRVD